MTTIPFYITKFTNFEGSYYFAQLKVEDGDFYKNRYFARKSALYAILKQQKGIKMHMISKINTPTTTLKQF